MSSYDSSLERLKEIVAQLESEDAISLDEYKRLAKEAKVLLNSCRKQLVEIEKETEALFRDDAE